MTAQKPTIEELERWFLNAWEPSIDADFVPLGNYAHEKLSTETWTASPSFADKVFLALASNLYECRAKTPAQLRKWCYRQIDRIAAALHRRQRKLRKNTKPFVYEQHGNKCFIPLRDSTGKQHLWIIPADWLEEARKLWPVYIRRYPDKRFYVARKVSVAQPDGSRVQQEVGIHRIFMGLGGVKHNFDDAAEVRANDGNWLNFADNNITLIKGTDLLDHCRPIDPTRDHLVTADWRPAKRVVTTSEEGRSDSCTWHEMSVRKWLRGGYEFGHIQDEELAPAAQEDDMDEDQEECDFEDYQEDFCE